MAVVRELSPASYAALPRYDKFAYADGQGKTTPAFRLMPVIQLPITAGFSTWSCLREVGNHE